MRRVRVVVAAVVGVVSAGVIADVAQAATLTVGVSPGCATIQACVDTASPGDTIRIPVGEYRENVVVDKAMIIEGYGPKSKRCAPDRVIVDGQPGGVAGIGFDVVADGVTIRCLTVRNGLTGIRAGFTAEDDGDPELFVDGFTLDRARVIAAQEELVSIFGDEFRIVRSTLRGGDGLNVIGSSGVLQGNTAESSRLSCFDLEVQDSLVRNNVAAICDSDGLRLTPASGNTIESNRVSNVRNQGIDVIGDENVVTRNRVEDTDSGAFAVFGDANVVRANHGESTSEDVFSLVCIAVDEGECTSLLVEDNVAIGNTSDGSGFDVGASDVGAADIEIFDNRAEGNQEEGFWLRTNGAIVRDNVSTGNGGSDGDQGSGFFIEGDENTLEGNVARRNREDGFRLFGDGNVLDGNISDGNLKDGYHVEVEEEELDPDPDDPSEGNVLDGNQAMGNQAEGIENDGVDTVLTDNTSMDNRTDCAGDGTVAVDSGNVCADGSTFTTPGEVDRVGR